MNNLYKEFLIWQELPNETHIGPRNHPMSIHIIGKPKLPGIPKDWYKKNYNDNNIK